VTSVFAAHLGTLGEQAVLPQSEDTLLCQLFTPVSDAMPGGAAYDAHASKGCQDGKACFVSAVHGMKEESLAQVPGGIVVESVFPPLIQQPLFGTDAYVALFPTARGGPLYALADSSAHTLVKRE